jgi:hypothetical protein
MRMSDIYVAKCAENIDTTHTLPTYAFYLPMYVD